MYYQYLIYMIGYYHDKKKNVDGEGKKMDGL